MSIIYFDPSQYIRGIKQLLASDKKHIGFLCGAGTSLAKKDDSLESKVPSIIELTYYIESELKKDDKYKNALNEIKKELEPQKFTVETLLSNIETKASIVCNGELNGLKKENFNDLSCQIKKLIFDQVSIHKKLKYEDMKKLTHFDFAQWIINASRKFPVEIFTTNYDYLFELGFEANEVPYYDGFTGSYNPFFNTASIEDMNFSPTETKLWKIHGSLGWSLDENTGSVIRHLSDKNDILIYPSISKYNNSKKQPYISLMDRLANFLKQPDSVLFICGYSFSDEHINDVILNSLKTQTTASVFAFYYDKHMPLDINSNAAKLAMASRKISIFGFRNAIIGCQFGQWQLKREPDKNDTININTYYDEDAPESSDAPLRIEQKENEEWTGFGELILPDFNKFVQFLKRLDILSKEDKG